ncbi:MAG: protein meaA, partial [Myxococcales bacterium]|nr:protein meaA [Myxococcales bacterium]
TPVQEIAYAMATALALLDAVVARDDVPSDAIPRVFGRISFFLNSSIRFVEETCKCRAMTQLWEEIGRKRYGITDAKLLRFRYGVQVNSLGLTEAQPENNVIRITLEALGVTLSKNARARAMQLPAWNEALGLPRPWDQQWSLRIQQILAYETDLLEYPDIFEGSIVIEERTAQLVEESRAELQKVLDMGGAVAAVENAYMKQRLVESHTIRIRNIESGEQMLVGVNAFTEGEESPLTAGGSQASILSIDENAEYEQIERLNAFRTTRSESEVKSALQHLHDVATSADNVLPASIRAAKAGVTTGEWTDVLRAIFGEYRAPTGIVIRDTGEATGMTSDVRKRVDEVSKALGRRIKLLVGKPGLDGHSNGAEQIAVKARDVGMEVVYDGIRLTPAEVVASAHDEGVHAIGLSILSGSHCVLVIDVLEGLKQAGIGHLPVIVGGIIPEDDADTLRAAGVRHVYTPRDYDLTRIMAEIVETIAEAHLSEAANAD